MATLKKILLVVLETYPFQTFYKLYFLYLARGKKIYYVSGMRRSGNHAFIAWLINSLERNKTKLDQDNFYKNFFSSSSQKTVFLNEVNEIILIVFLRMIFKKRNSIRECDTIIISTEDCHSDYTSYKIPRYDKAIHIKRTLLNLIASRLEYLVKKARQGKANYFSAIDEKILDKILSFENSSKFYVWQFEEWLASKSYREAFLKSLRLTSSELPGVSRFGGGSSFSGTDKTPNYSELIYRYKQVRFTKNIISLLNKKKYKNLLNEDEVKFLNKEYFD